MFLNLQFRIYISIFRKTKSMLFGRSGVVPGGGSLRCSGFPSCPLPDVGSETQVQRGYPQSRHLSQEGRCQV